MVKLEEFIELGFMPTYSKKKTEGVFKISGSVGDKPWRELRIIYNFRSTICKMEFSELVKEELIIQDLWEGKISSINELENKLQDLNGEY